MEISGHTAPWIAYVTSEFRKSIFLTMHTWNGRPTPERNVLIRICTEMPASLTRELYQVDNVVHTVSRVAIYRFPLYQMRLLIRDLTLLQHFLVTAPSGPNTIKFSILADLR